MLNWSHGTNDLVMSKNGEIKCNPIKLISARFEDVSTSKSMEDIYEQVLRGEKPEWVLRYIQFSAFGMRVVLWYDHPDGIKEEFGTYIEIDIENVIELTFETGCDENGVSNKYWMSGKREHPYNDTVGKKAGSHRYVHGPALVEHLQGGMLRRKYGFDEYEEEGGFRITEERF